MEGAVVCDLPLVILLISGEEVFRADVFGGNSLCEFFFWLGKSGLTLISLLDVIGEITFSKRFGFMDAGKDDGSFVQIETALRSAAWIGQVPWFYWIHDYFIPIFGYRLGIGARHGSLRSFASREIQDRKSRGSDHQDILAKLFAVQKEKPNEMNDMGVISMATSNIFAGSDTSAISIRSIVYHLCKNPQYKRKLVEEIDSQQQVGKLSIPAKFEEAQNMPYLQACLYEGLRCHPAVGMSLPRVTPVGGIAVDGRYIPEGVSDGLSGSLWRLTVARQLLV